MYGTVVGVLRGGPSSEHEVSLLSGHAVVANLQREKYTVRDIYIDKNGAWHDRGKPAAPADILQSIDVIISTLHGEYGENGDIQRMLEMFGIPYVGADALSSYLSMHKVLSKEKAKEVGIKTPKYRFIQEGTDVSTVSYEIVRTFQQPVIVKPVTGGSSYGVQIVGGYAQVHDLLTKILSEGSEALVEEMIRGTEATVGVVEGLRGEALYVLPPVEIVPPPGDYFSYESKYNGATDEIIPGRFQKPIRDDLINSARVMHAALGQRHYSRSDFIVSKNGIYFLELNNAVAVGLTKESLFPKSLASVGVTAS